ncbi:glutathione S-transferase N-terminal domain-containing protein [Aquirhabdus sp.]|uniref:glutathione S-transferase N-terminal domain-containing protein n=1 Tax=Aquirhabdus sp. TaxID=2824160 RepID=UPI00396C565F
MIVHQIKVLQSVVSTLLEGGRGVSGTANPKQPALTIQLYDMEGCPFCRRVREVLTMLNLDFEVYPCPKNGTRFRPIAEQIIQGIGGSVQFPLLVDENTGVKLQESQAIIDYLFQTYGKTGKTPAKWRNLSKQPVIGTLVSGARLMRGLKAAPTNATKALPAQLLQLWSFEASPYTRLVRERLCELELPYELHNVAKERWQDMGPAVLRLKPGPYVPLAGGKREREIVNMQGRLQVPYLIDPNMGVHLFESKDIIDYLNHTYS